MSFQIEFTGREVERTNVNQMVSSSSLTEDLREPSSGENYKYDNPVVADTYYWGVNTTTNFGYLVWTSSISISSLSPTATSHYDGVEWTYFRGAFQQTIVIPPLNFSNDFYTIYRTKAGPAVSITDATSQEGTAHSGGTASSETIATEQNGSDGVLGVAEDFGLIVKENGTEIAKVSHFPPAGAGEESSATVKVDAEITATSADLTVESYGLGSGQSLHSSNTEVLLEEI